MKHFNLLLATTVLATFGGIASADPQYRDYCIDGVPTPKAYTIICGRSMDGPTWNVEKSGDYVGFYTFDRDPTQFVIVFQSKDDFMYFNTDNRIVRVLSSLDKNCYDYRIRAAGTDDGSNFSGYTKHCMHNTNDLFEIPN